MRFFLIFLVLLAGVSAGAPRAKRGRAGARHRDHRSLCACANSIAAGSVLAASMLPAGSADAPLDQRRSCSRCRRWLPVRKALDAEFDRYIARHKADFRTKPSASEPDSIFSCSIARCFIPADTRFVLAGIVNRMDRAYVAPRELRRNPADLPPDADRCGRAGEVRCLAAAADDAERRAEGQRRSAIDGERQAITCAEIARRWLAAGDLAADRRRACGKTDGAGRPARSDRGRKTSTASKPIFRSRMRRNRRCTISAPTIC